MNPQLLRLIKEGKTEMVKQIVKYETLQVVMMLLTCFLEAAKCENFSLGNFFLSELKAMKLSNFDRVGDDVQFVFRELAKYQNFELFDAFVQTCQIQEEDFKVQRNGYRFIDEVMMSDNYYLFKSILKHENFGIHKCGLLDSDGKIRSQFIEILLPFGSIENGKRLALVYLLRFHARFIKNSCTCDYWGDDLLGVFYKRDWTYEIKLCKRKAKSLNLDETDFLKNYIIYKYNPTSSAILNYLSQKKYDIDLYRPYSAFAGFLLCHCSIPEALCHIMSSYNFLKIIYTKKFYLTNYGSLCPLKIAFDCLFKFPRDCKNLSKFISLLYVSGERLWGCENERRIHYCQVREAKVLSRIASLICPFRGIDPERCITQQRYDEIQGCYETPEVPLLHMIARKGILNRIKDCNWHANMFKAVNELHLPDLMKKYLLFNFEESESDFNRFNNESNDTRNWYNYAL